MTTALFTILVTALSSVSMITTEAVKRSFENAKKEYSANILALVNALVVGCGGTLIAYLLLGIAFTVSNIACALLMGVVVWIGSMIGYDKVKQLVEQVLVVKSKKEKE